jgi:hypothetical protein
MSLCLTKHHLVKIYGGSGDIAPPFLTLTLDGGEWSALTPAALPPRKEVPLPI